ncbi:hypothetical protein Tco_1087750 [Tanacetum coccineum]
MTRTSTSPGAFDEIRPTATDIQKTYELHVGKTMDSRECSGVSIVCIGLEKTNQRLVTGQYQKESTHTIPNSYKLDKVVARLPRCKNSVNIWHGIFWVLWRIDELQNVYHTAFTPYLMLEIAVYRLQVRRFVVNGIQ